MLGRCIQRHRHQEFLRFLNAIERAVPAGKVIRAILDNYGSHQHPKVLKWLGRHPRWVFHFTPTAGSWLNMMSSFSALTRRRIRRGSFHSIVDLQAAINRYIGEHNADPETIHLNQGEGHEQIVRADHSSECVCALAVCCASSGGWCCAPGRGVLPPWALLLPDRCRAHLDGGPDPSLRARPGSAAAGSNLKLPMGFGRR